MKHGQGTAGQFHINYSICRPEPWGGAFIQRSGEIAVDSTYESVFYDKFPYFDSFQYVGTRPKAPRC